MKPQRLFALGIATTGFALLMALSAWAQNNSHARIVRLSFVEGVVAVQRPDVRVWSQAPVNTPIQEGFKLSTGENSFAEVQFENGGTIRLGQLALLDFTQLQMAPSGGKINHVELRQGYGTFHLLNSRLGDSLQVVTASGTLNAQGDAEFRVDLDQGLERVEVFDGSVDLQSNLGGITVQAESVLVIQPGAANPTVVSQGITKDDWDQWVDNREAHTDMQPSGPSPDTYAGDAGENPYGWSDLTQYGNWADVPGAGYGWSPNVSNGWSPYSAGQWCWYAGLGFVWIGAEPWGWLPYHYGGWDFILGRGWVWFPGSFKTWSPSQVTWFHGPNWVGWIPRPPRKGGAIACGNNCGGGVVNTSTFQRGGVLNSSLMMNVNPTSGAMATAPGVMPLSSAMMTGPVVSFPASHRPGSQGNPGQASAVTGVPANTTTSAGWQHVGAAHPGAAIVWDSQQDSYVNGRRGNRQQGQSTSPTGAGAYSTTTPGAKPGWTQPVPVGSQQPSGLAGQNQVNPQADPTMGVNPIRPVPVGGHGNPDNNTPPTNPGTSDVKRGTFGPNPNPQGSRSPATAGQVGSGGQGGGTHAGGGGGAGAGGHAGNSPAGGGSTTNPHH